MANTRKLVGYTTGVFDMFHIGHLRLLERASQNCDYLIVGVSSDELVENYKKKSPIIPLEHRIEIVSALGVVDKVVVQSHRDKIAQYHEIKYDRLFVGDDWKGNTLFVELEAELSIFGAEIKYFEYTKEVSSSKFTMLLQEIYNEEINH